MTRSRQALRGLMVGYFGTVINTVANLVVVPIILGYIDREQYGLWMTVAQAMGYMGLLELGLGASTVRFVANIHWRNDPDEMSRLVSSALVVYLAQGAVFLVAGLLLYRHVPTWMHVAPEDLPITQTMVLVSVIWGSVRLPLGIFSNIQVGAQRFVLHRGLDVLATCMNLALAVLLLRMGWGLLALPAALAGSGLLRFAASIGLTWRILPGLRISPAFVERRWLRELLSFSVHTFMLKLTWVVIFSTDNLVIGRLIGLTGVTIYSLTFRLPNTMASLIRRISNTAIPGIAELEDEGSKARLQSVVLDLFRIALEATGCGGIVAVALNQSFVRLWVGEENFGGLGLTVVFAVLGTYHAVSLLCWDILNGLGRIKLIGIVGVVEAGLNIGLSILLAPMLGIAGVALATLISGLSTSGWVRVWEVVRALSLTSRDLARVGIWRILATWILTGGAAVLTQQLIAPVNWGGLIANVAVVSLVGGLAFWNLALDEKDRSRYRARLRTVL